jgi:hypothetical protein
VATIRYRSFYLSRIVGVIYPIPLRFVSRIFVEKKDVFVKYLAHQSSVRLTPKNKILFYASQAQKEIVGEATIKAIEFLAPVEVLEKYDNRVFLNRDELTEYASHQLSRTTSKKMLVLVLSGPKKYERGISYGKPISMAGEYLTEENYAVISRKSK